jgi:hypothetical protein
MRAVIRTKFSRTFPDLAQCAEVRTYMMPVNTNTVGAWMKAKIAPLLLIAIATVATVASYPARAATPEADFAARCAAPGVVLCKGLDAESDLQAGEMGTAADGTRQGFIDTTASTSGGGSLMFTLRSGVSDKNIGGYWETGLGHAFVTGETIYVQYRWKASSTYFSNNNNYWNSSVKQINIHGPSSTCQGSEFTTILSKKRIEMYTNCGDGWFTNVDTNVIQSGCPADCLIQQGSSTTPAPSGDGYNCHYQNQFAGTGNGSGCFWPVADKWYTIYEKIKLGTLGGSNTIVESWESHDGLPFKQFHRVNGVTWHSGDNNFSKLRFETYMTEIGSSAPTAAYVWYDELVVSTQPIAAPGNAGPAPSGLTPPTNLRVAQ